METTRCQQVLEMVRQAGILRPLDLQDRGIARVHLSRLYRRGLLEKIGRGLYRLPQADVTQHHSLAEVGRRVPSGVVCLLSALSFHELTTQSPHEVWIAIDRKGRLPKSLGTRLRVIRFSGAALTSGVQEHKIEGVTVRVYDPAKTVVDCFKYRNKIGLDVALEALRDYRRLRKRRTDDLWRYAKICRVTEVIRPYLEAMM